MRLLVYILSLVLSLPNLLAGLAFLWLKHGFSSRNLLKIVFDLLVGALWALPVAVGGFLLLLVAGLFSSTRVGAALLLFILNLAALMLVLTKLGAPTDLSEGAVFLPLLFAQLGCGWLVARALA